MITTCYRPTERQKERCVEAQKMLGGEIIARNKQSIASLIQQYGKNILVVSDNKLSYYIEGFEHPLFFHPGSTMFRVKRFIRGGEDPFLAATQLKKGMSILDTTMGMGTDAVLSSFVVGPSGQAVALEKNPLLAYIVEEGFKYFKYDLNHALEEAMRRIQVYVVDHEQFLRKASNDSFDVVYFDPMFQKPIVASKGIEGLRKVSYYDELNETIIEEAKRVAKQRVVIKAHYESELFVKYDFHVLKRKTAQFHYGVIEKSI